MCRLGCGERTALEAGDPDDGIITAGMVIGLIDDLPTCAELLENMVAECRERLRVAVGLAG